MRAPLEASGPLGGKPSAIEGLRPVCAPHGQPLSCHNNERVCGARLAKETQRCNLDGARVWRNMVNGEGARESARSSEGGENRRATRCMSGCGSTWSSKCISLLSMPSGRPAVAMNHVLCPGPLSVLGSSSPKQETTPADRHPSAHRGFGRHLAQKWNVGFQTRVSSGLKIDSFPSALSVRR